MKYFLNSKPLSNRTSLVLVYLLNQVLLNSPEIRSEVLYTLGTYTISNRPVLGSRNIMAIDNKIIGIPLASSHILFTVKGSMRLSCTYTRCVASITSTASYLT